MVTYFIVCAIMLILVYIRIAGEVIQFRRKYPRAIFKKSNFFKAFADLAKLIIMFLIPLINLLIFFAIMFKISDEEIERVIKEKCEVYQTLRIFKKTLDIYLKVGYTIYRKRGNAYG